MRIFFVFLFLPFGLISQNKYSVDSISPALMHKADAVIRSDETNFRILDISNGLLNRHQVITILNERGAKLFSAFYTYYDKFDKIEKLKGIVYDKTGRKLYELGKKDISDISYNAYIRDVTDLRVKICEFDNISFQYPYTIEFFSSVKTKNMMFFPKEYFYAGEHLSIQKKSVIVETSLKNSFRIEEKNIPNRATEVIEGKIKKYCWEVKDISCSDFEQYTPIDAYPLINTAPKEFAFEKYHANIQSWSDVAKFYGELNKGRDVLTENTITKVKGLLRNEKDTLKKIELLYNFLQNNTRYVSIQLGIGGWQTIEAKDVAEKGYGDCKALSNYMKALLNEAGIFSCVALIRAGNEEPEIELNFANFRFNHVIICIPLKNDTIWLECTNQTDAMGYQGSFTGNRRALLILEEGGKLVNTSKYNYNDNIIERVGTISLDEFNNAVATIKTKYKAISQEYRSFLFHNKNIEEQKRFLINELSLSSFELEKFSLTENKSKTPLVEENLDLKINRLFSNTGSLYFLKPKLFSTNQNEIPTNNIRTTPFYLNPNEFEKTEKDSLTFIIPNIYIPEFSNKSVFFKSKFGEYSLNYKIQQGNLVYNRKLVLFSGYFQKSEYPEWIDFMKKVDKNDSDLLPFKIKP